MSKDFNELATILNRLVKSLGIENKIYEARAIEVWPQAVGQRIAALARINKIENGVIYLNVTSDVWRNELLFHKKQIISEVNKLIKKNVIRDILFY